ncbi:MAG: RNA-binding S4 domain-containing protein [Acidobacteriota bacterium]|nr:RNA-binding S4 domain-containing protein [Acidobacteriota bacterium]
MRLDVWLDVACVFPTRSQAKAAVEGGKVEVNGSRAKPHREVRAGDRITVTADRSDPRVLLVRGLASRSIPKTQARKLYEDVSPPPSAEVAEARRLDRILAGRPDAGKPDRRERRERRERKGWDGR